MRFISLLTFSLIFATLAFAQVEEIDSLRSIEFDIEKTISDLDDSLKVIRNKIKLLESEERLAANKISGKVESVEIELKKTIDIHETPTRSSDKIISINEGEIVEVVAFDYYWLLVKYDSYTGWAYKFDIPITEDLKTFEFVYNERKKEAEKAALEEQKEKEKQQLIAKWEEIKLDPDNNLDFQITTAVERLKVTRIRYTGSSLMHSIEVGERFAIWNIDEQFIWVKCMDQESFELMNGYVSRDDLTLTDEMSDIISRLEVEKQKAREQEEKEKQERIKAEQERKEKLEEEQRIRREEYRQDLISRFGNVIAERILAKKIWIGMTKEQLILSWGRPTDINRSVYSFGVNEQWVYSSAYVYLEDDIVTSWQD